MEDRDKNFKVLLIVTEIAKHNLILDVFAVTC